MKKTAVSLFICAPIFSIMANETPQPDLSGNPSAVTAASALSSIERMSVNGVRSRLNQQGRLQDTVQKTESLDASFLLSKHAFNLTSALQDEPGVRISNECSMCGAKRVMLNGMRGEHTTVLVDDLPIYTMLSGFYAMDAIATAGLARIDIARGAGASLLAPEAIGGTVNIISKEALRQEGTLDFSVGEHGFRTGQAFYADVLNDGRSGFTLTAQHDQKDQTDVDSNGVSESPLLKNNSLTARLSHDLTDQTNTILRFSTVSSEVFGGPVLGNVVDSIGQALDGYDQDPVDQLFDNNQVTGRFIGKPWQTTEWVKTSRNEAYNKWLHDFNAQTTLQFAVSYADHLQDSFYEGIDYKAENDMLYLRAQADYQWSTTHNSIIGLDNRQEKMRSETEALQDVAAFVSDSFDYQTAGLYAQHHWQPQPQLDVALALRLDRIKADFVDISKPGVEIDQTIFAPRADMRYFHNEQWTSRVSVGRGYRAPLSFFESEHGILDAEKGFQIAVSELEQSNSVNYALSYEGDRLSSTFSTAWTQVEHLASLEETADGTPVLSQLQGKASVFTTDLVLGYQLNDFWVVNMTLENFDYDDNFRASYAIAPVEQRASLDFDFEADQLKLHLAYVWFSARDLRQYSYQGFDDRAATLQKPLDAPAYGQLDFKLQYQLTEPLELYIGGNNLLNQTQTRQHSSPLMFDADGNYDVAYIFGQLQPRIVYLGLRYSL